MSFRERLLWLEQATAFARKLQQGPLSAESNSAHKFSGMVAEEQAPYGKSPGPNPRQ